MTNKDNPEKDIWITNKEAQELTGKSDGTIRAYCKEEIFLCERAKKGRGSSPFMINKASIPGFMRVKKD